MCVTSSEEQSFGNPVALVELQYRSSGNLIEPQLCKLCKDKEAG